mgnify:CR=1 FL=1
MSFDFDRPIPRIGTHSAKWDSLPARFGIQPEGTLPMWVADMEFAAPPAVNKALQDAIDLGVQRLQERRLGDIELIGVRQATRFQVRAPVEMRRQRLKGFGIELVIEQVGIAAHHTRQLWLRQRGFDRHHRVRMRGGLIGLIAQQHEHPAHVGAVLLASVVAGAMFSRRALVADEVSA